MRGDAPDAGPSPRQKTLKRLTHGRKLACRTKESVSRLNKLQKVVVLLQESSIEAGKLVTECRERSGNPCLCTFISYGDTKIARTSGRLRGGQACRHTYSQ